jgi:DNA-binding transcriptional MerR regulator
LDHIRKSGCYHSHVSVVELVDDLIALAQLAEQESDASRKGRLAMVHDHLAARDRGAKVSEAAQILGVSAPTIRSWIDIGLLETVSQRPVRVDVVSLAAAKRAVDEIRRHKDDRHLLADIGRILRDRAGMTGEGAAEGIEDFRAGRVTRLDRARLEELLPPKRGSSR